MNDHSYISLLTSFAPAITDNDYKIQSIAAYSFSLLKNCEVFVLDDNTQHKQICDKYGFTHVEGFKTGKSVGINTNAFLFDSAFQTVNHMVKGQIVVFINGDNILLPCDLFTFCYKMNKKTNGNFICLGRRHDLAFEYYQPLLQEVDDICYEKFLSRFGLAKRIIRGFDIYVWSLLQFNKIRLLPVLVDGWSWDNWLVNDAYINCENVFYLSGYVESIHSVHTELNVRQQTLSLASTKYNQKIICDAYPDINTGNMQTPQLIPKEWCIK